MTSPSLYRQTGFPVFQNRTYATAEEARDCALGDIDLAQDPTTGIITNRAFELAKAVYDTDYNNEQSHSPRFQAHMDDVAALITAHMGLKNLIEVGCGKGAFLEQMIKGGADITGFDPTYEGNNPLIRKSYFNPDLGIEGDGLILRHVLEHIPQPVDFLKQLAEANGGKGLIYIEVPCLDWILENRAWFDIFYEHVNYFRMDDFARMFGRVLVSERRFGGQYLSIIADLSTLRDPAPDADVDWPQDFSAGLSKSDTGGMVWGGASKGVIFSLLRLREGRPVDGVIDINPDKQGRYLPVTGLRVTSPEDATQLLAPGTLIYVMNPNYFDEIKAMTGNRFSYERTSL
ncbi:class I SAM-dependent methyltransferase [Thioclava sp.]|uniref:class I SAM-dependent methyltransferase n=1 Tax=Thioclava sp. TaxID=1933450 RepID=UPI003AA8735D